MHNSITYIRNKERIEMQHQWIGFTLQWFCSNYPLFLKLSNPNQFLLIFFLSNLHYTNDIYPTWIPYKLFPILQGNIKTIIFSSKRIAHGVYKDKDGAQSEWKFHLLDIYFFHRRVETCMPSLQIISITQFFVFFT